MTNPLLALQNLECIVPNGSTLPLIFLDSTKRIGTLTATSAVGSTILTTDNTTQTAPGVVGTRFIPFGTSVLPGATPSLSPTCILYVVSVAGNNIELSKEPNGAAIVFNSATNFTLYEPLPVIQDSACGGCVNSIITIADAVRLEIDDYGCLGGRPTHTFANPQIKTPSNRPTVQGITRYLACYCKTDNTLLLSNKTAGTPCAEIDFDTWGFVIDGSATPGNTAGLFKGKAYQAGGFQVPANADYQIRIEYCVGA